MPWLKQILCVAYFCTRRRLHLNENVLFLRFARSSTGVGETLTDCSHLDYEVSQRAGLWKQTENKIKIQNLNCSCLIRFGEGLVCGLRPQFTHTSMNSYYYGQIRAMNRRM